MAVGDINALAVIDAATLETVATIAVGQNPRSVTISPDGTTALAESYFDNAVTVVDVATRVVTSVISIGLNPVYVQFSPDGSRAYVAVAGDWTIGVILFDPALYPQPAAPALARTGENLGGLVPIAGGLLALGIVLRSRRKHSTP